MNKDHITILAIYSKPILLNSLPLTNEPWELNTSCINLHSFHITFNNMKSIFNEYYEHNMHKYITSYFLLYDLDTLEINTYSV